MPPTGRVYSEMLPYEDLVRPRALRLLARSGLELVLAVRPWDLGDVPDVARTLRDAGVPLSIWPMLGDEGGRWANVHNAAAFASFALAACDALESARAPARDVLFDLEPPLARARSIVPGAPGVRRIGELARAASEVVRSRRERFDAAADVLARATSAIHARGMSTSAAVLPLVALDPPHGHGWQSLLGTPVDVLGAGHVSVMMYTSMLEGWSRGALRRRDATALLDAATARAVKRWGERAGVSLGCVGRGALQHEPTYRDPSELAEDVAIVRAAGCERLSLFELGGILSREPAEAWLEAFAAAGDAPAPAPSARVRAARRIARAATRAIAR